MPTAQHLAQTYSFIGPLQADPVLAQYGDNALPLFATALHLDIEDLASFASRSQPVALDLEKLSETRKIFLRRQSCLPLPTRLAIH